MTKKQILKETRDFYAKDPLKRRSVAINGRCAYNGLNNTHCAIARIAINPETLLEGLSFKNVVGGMNDSSLVPVGILKPQYDGHNVGFWRDIQYFHASKLNWTNKGLSAYGKLEYEGLLLKYSKI